MSKELIREIRADSNYAKFMEVLTSVESAIDLAQLEKELKLLHSARPSRNLRTATLTPINAWNAVASDLSNRARLIEIHVSVYRSAQVLEAAIDQTRSYLSVRYQDDINAVARNAPARKQFMDYILRKGTETHSALQAFLEIVNMYVRDIDQAAYALRNGIDVLKLQIERPNQVV